MTKTTFWRQFYFLLVILPVAISFLVIIGWLFDSEIILKYVAGDSGMKFNTALFFFLISFILLDNKKKFLPTFINYAILIFVAAISFFTLLEYRYEFSFTFDNLVIYDDHTDVYPGRMSIGTAIGFIIMVSGLILKKPSIRQYTVVAQLLFAVVISLAVITIISYTLNIPIENKSTFIETMAINTAILFLFQAFTASLKNKHIGLFSIFFSNLQGSQILKNLLPVIVLIPIIFSYILLTLLNNSVVKTDFGIVLYTVVLIIATISSTAYISKNLNKIDFKRKKLELVLNETNASLTQFKQAFDRVSLIVMTDIAGYIIEVNDKFCQTSQYSREELIGKKLSIIKTNHHSTAFFGNLWKSISAGNVWHGEIMNKAKDGSIFWVNTAIVPFHGADNKPSGYLAVNNEITENKISENLANKLTSSLIEKNKDLEQFVYIASHDLQEPLLTIQSISKMLSTEYRAVLDKNAQSYIDFISGSVSRMHLLVKDLMDHSRLGKEFKFYHIDTNEIVNQIQKDLSKKIIETNTTIIVEDLPDIIGNEAIIRQLFQNLITNAIKFREKDMHPIITLRGGENKTHWQFSVSDNGIGIKKKDRIKIFKIFQRLHRHEVYKGTGIGLANCKKIVEIHHGKIWVKPNESRGSTFIFTINKKLTNENSKISNADR